MGKENKTALPQTIEEAHSLIEAQNAQLAESKKTIDEQASLIDELSEALAKVETKLATSNVAPSVTIGKKSYTVNAGVKHLGVNYTPAELAANEALCAEILKLEGQTILVEEK